MRPTLFDALIFCWAMLWRASLLLLLLGPVIFMACPSCLPCAGGSPPAGCVTCTNCLCRYAPTTYNVSFTGITNNNCGTCTSFHQSSFPCSFVGISAGVCTWQTTVSDVCGATGSNVKVQISSTSIQAVFSIAGDVVTYGVTPTYMDCLIFASSFYDLPKLSQVGTNCTWPATVRIAAATTSCCNKCSCGSDTTQVPRSNNFYLTLHNVSGCSALDGIVLGPFGWGNATSPCQIEVHGVFPCATKCTDSTGTVTSASYVYISATIILPDDVGLDDGSFSISFRPANADGGYPCIGCGSPPGSNPCVTFAGTTNAGPASNIISMVSAACNPLTGTSANFYLSLFGSGCQPGGSGPFVNCQEIDCCDGPKLYNDGTSTYPSTSEMYATFSS